MTTLGTYVGLKAAVKHRLGADTTKGMTVAIQGLGKVGMGLAASLHKEGAKLIVSDVNAEAVKAAVDALRRDGGFARRDRDRGLRCAVAECAGRDPERYLDPEAQGAVSLPARPTTSSRATSTARC